MDRSGHMLEQRYRLGHMLGQGGMAAVYLAEDTKLGKAVAVKVLNPEYALQPKVVQRFIQEARSITRVRHPNVIDVTDYGVTPDQSVFLVMELLHGEDLSAMLDREGPLPWSRLAPIVLQICAALVVVHQGGIVHRDIKPSNCFRIRVAGNPDFIKVLDFGIAKVLAGPAAPGAPQSTTGSLLGTPEYMAPELPRGLRPDARVDIYALGVLMYKMLTGSAPFSAEVYMAVLAKHMFDPVEPPRQRAPQREIPEAVEAVILRALAKERDDRYPSMQALAEAIVATLPDQPAAVLWLEASREVPIAESGADIRGETMLAPNRRPQGEINPALDPSATLARRRVAGGAPALTLILATAALGVLLFGVLRRCGGDPGAAPDEAAPAATKLASETGSRRQTEAAKGPAAAGPVVPVVPAAGVPAPAKPAGASKPEPRRRPVDTAPPLLGHPPFDRERAAATLDGAMAKLRACTPVGAAPFNLVIEIGKQGRVTTIEPSRIIEDATLACMRKVLEGQPFRPSSDGGRIVRPVIASGG